MRDIVVVPLKDAHTPARSAYWAWSMSHVENELARLRSALPEQLAALPEAIHAHPSSTPACNDRCVLVEVAPS